LLDLSIDYKLEFVKIFNLIVFNTIIATTLIAFYEKQKVLLLTNRNRYIFLNRTKDFCANKLGLFDYKFYKEQTTIKEINLYI